MQPREKFLNKGASNMTVQELFSILLGTGIKGHSHEEISRKIVKTVWESDKLIVDEIFAALSKLKGIGEAKALRIAAGIELGKRLYVTQSARRKIVTSKDAVELFSEIRNKKREYVKAAFLNARFEVLSVQTIAIGSVNASSVQPRDILVPALEQNAVSVIMAHNHPSGDSNPSREDIEITKRLVEAFKFVGVGLLDHLILANNEWKRIALD